MADYGQGTTPYMAFQVESDLTDAEQIMVTIKQGSTLLNLDISRVEAETEDGASTLTVHLTQEETLRFSEGRAQVQIRWRKNGEAYITEENNIRFFRALYRGVI